MEKNTDYLYRYFKFFIVYQLYKCYGLVELIVFTQSLE